MDSFVLKELEKFKDLKFDEESHSYTVNGISLVSVTQLVSTTTFFDKEKAAARKAESLNIPVRDIILMWDKKGEYARTMGHEMHSFIENLWQGKKYNWKNNDKFIEFKCEGGKVYHGFHIKEEQDDFRVPAKVKKKIELLLNKK